MSRATLLTLLFLAALVLALFSGCAPAYTVSGAAPMVAPPTARQRVTVEVHWYEDGRELSKACAVGYPVRGCAVVRGQRCLVRVLRLARPWPMDKLGQEVLGHEMAHCLGGTHPRARSW